jgi:molybdate transport system ATP-binding protein
MTAALEVTFTHRLDAFALAVDFRVESGLAVLFGPSGSGKSTTLAVIAGLIRPETGIVAIRGRVVTDRARNIHVSPQHRRVGMVFQDGLLLPHRTVLDNVALAVRDAPDRRQRRASAKSWLERVGAHDLADRRPGSLSGGQRQRVALARGLAGSPDLLLLDEPLSSVDLVVRRQLGALIREVIVASGVPSILVTHDAQEAADLGDLIIDYDVGGVTGQRPVHRDPPPLPAAR